MTENIKGYYQPVYNPDWNIYDCFYSDMDELVIITPAEIRSAPKIRLLESFDSASDSTGLETQCYRYSEFAIHKCPHKHTYVYKLDSAKVKAVLGLSTNIFPDKICISIQSTKSIDSIDSRKSIKSNNTGNDINLVNEYHVLELNVNRYPIFKDEVIMSTLVKNEDNIIRTWVDFHLRLGVDRIIIYDNKCSPESNKNNTTTNYKLNTQDFSYKSSLIDLLADYITSEKVIIINWPYAYTLNRSGISCQTTQQTHSCHVFRTAKWIGLLDVDEFVNIQSPEIILGSRIQWFLDDVILKSGISKARIGGVQFRNKFFYNPDKLPVDDGCFLRITSCAGEVLAKGREKCFVIPANILTFSVHTITLGGQLIKLSPKLGYFNHYIYLNKSDRGYDRTPWNDMSISRYLPPS